LFLNWFDFQEELAVTKDQIAIAYVRLGGPKAQALIHGQARITFQMTDKVYGQQSSGAKVNGDGIDFSIEGRLGELQKQCFHDLMDYAKTKALELGVGVGTVAGVQVGNCNLMSM